MKHLDTRRVASFATGALCFVSGGWCVLQVIARTAPTNSVVKLLGGLLPGHWVLTAALALVAFKFWRLVTYSRGATIQTGAPRFSLAWMGARSFLEGGLLIALIVGALNPAIRPTPIMLLDLPEWERDNWNSKSEQILRACATIANQHKQTGLRVMRAKDDELTEDEEFGSLLQRIASDNTASISNADKTEWESLVSDAWQEAQRAEDDRRVIEPLRIIFEDLTGVSAKRANIPDQQVIYVVSLGKATSKRIKDTTSNVRYWPLPEARGVSSTWRAVDAQAATTDEPSIVGWFFTQASYYKPRVVLTYEWPPDEKLPTVQLKRYINRNDATASSQDQADNIAELKPDNSVPVMKDGEVYLDYSTVRAGPLVSLTLQGPALSERFAPNVHAFEKLVLEWKSTSGKEFSQTLHPSPFRRLAVLDLANVSEMFPEAQRQFTVIPATASDEEKAKCDVVWTNDVASTIKAKPTIIVVVGGTPAAKSGFCSLQAPLMRGEVGRQFQRGWAAYHEEKNVETGDGGTCFYLERKVPTKEPDVFPIAWFDKSSSAARVVIKAVLPDQTKNTAWLTGNHRDALLHMLKSLSAAAFQRASVLPVSDPRTPANNATQRWKFTDVGQSASGDVSPRDETDRPLWKEVCYALWPDHESNDFYIPTGTSSLRPNCRRISIACIGGVLLVWSLGLYYSREARG